MLTLEEGMKLQKDIVERSDDFLKRMTKFYELIISPPDIKVGQTPSEVVYRKHKIKLLRYVQKQPIYKTPILITYALVNKPYILDLLPGRSVVEVLVSKGFDVYLIDWGTPTDSDKCNGLDKYVNFYMDKIVDKVIEISESDQVNLLGYCMGGTMSLLYTALHPEKIKNLIVMATPFDTTKDDGLLFKWSKEFPIEEVEERFGNCPGWFLGSSFSMLNPMDRMDKVISFYKGILNENCVELFLAMEKWLGDTIDVPGRAYTEFIKGCFQDHLLVKNQFVVGDEKVDLRKIECPFLNLVALEDTSVPPSASLGIGDRILSRDKEIMTANAGHIGLSVSGKSLKTLWPKVTAWIGQRSEKIKSEE